jgi:K+-transporting ATPase ATPase C chain
MNTVIKETITSILAMIVFGIVLCGLYPLVVWGAGQLLFSHQANGSLITGADGKIVGSEWLGQSFSTAKYFHPRPSAAGNGYDASSSGGANLGPTSKKLINGTTKSTAVADKDGKLTPGPDVVDYDGIKLRIVGYCDENGISYQLLQGDQVVDAKTFKNEKGDWDQVKLITAFNDESKPLTVKPSTLIPGDAVTSSGSGLDPHISVKNALIQVPRVAKERGLSKEAVEAEIAKATARPSLGVLGEPGVNVLLLNLALDKLAAK